MNTLELAAFSKAFLMVPALPMCTLAATPTGHRLSLDSDAISVVIDTRAGTPLILDLASETRKIQPHKEREFP